MKKLMAVLAAGFVMLGLLFCLLVGDPYDFYQRHYARIPHVTGQINLIINGEETPIGDDCNFTYDNSSLKQPKKLVLQNGSFTESFGDHGTNTMMLDLSSDFCITNINKNMTKGMKIEFGYWTSNNWHKDNTDLNIFVDNIGESSCTVKLMQIVTGDDTGDIEKSFIINYDSDDNYIKISRSFI